MPTYPYKCKCGHVQEEKRTVAERDNAPTCARCGAKMARQFVTAPFRVRKTHISEL